jgi:hypothetical protein
MTPARKPDEQRKQPRSVIDEVGDRLRGLLDELDRLINPQPAQKQPVPVPVPVRVPRRPYSDERYR